MVWFLVNPTKSNQNLRVFSELVNLQDCVCDNLADLSWRPYCRKGDNSLQHYYLVHKFILMPQAREIPAAKAAVDKECEQLEKIRRGTWRKSKVRKRWSMKQGRRAQKFISIDWWTSVIQKNAEVGGKMMVAKMFDSVEGIWSVYLLLDFKGEGAWVDNFLD